MTEWVISDIHAWHDNINRLCNRPFANGHEGAIAIANNINSLVQPDDTLYNLGDDAWHGRASEFYAMLNCKNIVSLKGNHDPDNDGIERIPYLELKRNKIHVVLCHYPFESWNRKSHGSVHLHGHTHNNLPSVGVRRLDVGVDSIGFSPITLQDAIDRAIENGGNKFAGYP